MADQNSQVNPETEVADEGRRDFVKTAGKAAVAAPAVFVLLNAMTKPASAAPVYSTGGPAG